MDIQFPEYNGWKNYATWAVYTHITDNNLERIYREKGVQTWLTLKLKGFFSITYKDPMRENLMGDLLGLAVQFVEWPLVLLDLECKELYKEPSNLDDATVEYLEVGLWQSIINGREGREEAELKSWVQGSILTWIESPDTRTHTTSRLSTLAKKYFDIVLDSIDWDRLTIALKGE